MWIAGANTEYPLLGMEEQQVEAAREQAAPAKGKKGKLPLILMLAVVLGGGGFFMMKGKGGKAAKPEVKLGKIAKIEEEFLIPLMGQGNYLRTNISFHFKEGFDDHAFVDQIDAVRDAINMKLKSKYLKELESLDDIRALKKELAKEVNELLHHDDHGAEGADAAKPADEGKGHGDGHEAEKSKAKGKAKPEAPKEPKHPDWDSQEGPVLKVYFTTFATQ